MDVINSSAETPLPVGSVVRSAAGRDSGRIYSAHK